MKNQKPPWKRDRSKNSRNINYKNKTTKILIVCEGEKTEPNYFRAFPVDTDVVELKIKGTGRNTDSLVKKAIELRDTAEKSENSYNQVWCVFDRDSFPAQNFNRAIEIANKEKFKVAYSNQSFELWYLLHFNYYDTSIQRSDYIKKLTTLLKKQYKKNDENIYEELKSKQAFAIKNAIKLLKYHNTQSPEMSDPSTTVYELVERLNEFIEE